MPSTKVIHAKDARKMAFIVGACCLSIDVVLTSIGFFEGEIAGGRTPALDVWDLIKALLLAFALLFAAWRVRSRGLAFFALVFTTIGIADFSFGHDQIAEWLVSQTDLGGIVALIPGESTAWVELLILTTLASLMAVLIWLVKDSWEGYESVRRVLVGLLGVLIFFAVGVDLLATSASSSEVLTLIEETGERVALSVTLAYAAGVATYVSNGPS